MKKQQANCSAMTDTGTGGTVLERLQGLGVRVAGLEERAEALEAGLGSEGKELRRALQELHAALQTEEVSREIAEERKGKELRKTESAITLELGLERRARQEEEARILKQLDERCLALSLELGAHTFGASAAPSAPAGGASDADRIIEVLEKERQERHAFEAQVLSKVDSETKRLERLIDMEKTFREEATRVSTVSAAMPARCCYRMLCQLMFALQDMITMIEKTKLRVQMDMDKARAEREAAEDTILRVLDQSTSGLLKQDALTATRPLLSQPKGVS